MQNTEIYSIYYGEVTTAASSEVGYGNHVIIRSTVENQSIEILYGHMHSSPVARVDEKVAPVSLLGGIGNTGDSRGFHLHIRVTADGESVNPDPNYTRNPTTYDNNPYDHSRLYKSYIPYKID